MSGQDSATQFDELFAAHYGELLRFAVRRVGSDTAPDVVADVFLVAWRRREELDRVAVRPWLFGIAGKVVLNQWRAQSRQRELIGKLARIGSRPSPQDEPAWVDRVHRALRRLPAGDQELLRLTEWDQLGAAEAAAALGCSTGALRVRLHRARRRFAAELANVDAEGADPNEEVQADEQQDRRGTARAAGS